MFTLQKNLQVVVIMWYNDDFSFYVVADLRDTRFLGSSNPTEGCFAITNFLIKFSGIFFSIGLAMFFMHESCINLEFHKLGDFMEPFIAR